MKKKFNLSKVTDNILKYCALSSKKSFKKNEIITTYLLKRNQICILLSGIAHLIRYTSDGERRIVYSFKAGDAFGEAFYKLHTSRELFVEAKRDCEVLFLPYDKLDNCAKECTYHLTLIKELPNLFMNRMAELNMRTELLTYKGTREKLIAYFNNVSSEVNSNSIELTFSYIDLADYLVLDRSAMMRELSRMVKEGIIEKNGKKITLRYKEKVK